MGKRKKKRGKRPQKLQRKEVMFRLPLRDFLLLFPGFPLPPDLDAFDPAYEVRFRPTSGGGVLTEIGYNEDYWLLE